MVIVMAAMVVTGMRTMVVAGVVLVAALMSGVG